MTTSNYSITIYDKSTSNEVRNNSIGAYFLSSEQECLDWLKENICISIRKETHEITQISPIELIKMLNDKDKP